MQTLKCNAWSENHTARIESSAQKISIQTSLIPKQARHLDWRVLLGALLLSCSPFSHAQTADFSLTECEVDLLNTGHDAATGGKMDASTTPPDQRWEVLQIPALTTNTIAEIGGGSQVWEYCAKEGEFCNFSGSKIVRFGSHGSFVNQLHNNGVACNVATFGGGTNFVDGCYLQTTGSWEPATVSGDATGNQPGSGDGNYFDSPFINAEWISHSSTGRHGPSGGIDTSVYADYLFRINFEIDLYDAALFGILSSIDMTFYADNTVWDIVINGISLRLSGDFPQIPSTGPPYDIITMYQAEGYTEDEQTLVNIPSELLQQGTNEIIVHVKSGPALAGFLAQMSGTCGEVDFGDAPDVDYKTLSVDGPAHVIDNQLLLGSSIEGETNGQPSDAADLDGAEEDGVSFRTPVGSNQSLYADVEITNAAGGTVTTCCWLDVPSGGSVDGVFDSSDGQCMDTSLASTTLTFQWSNLPTDQIYDTYLRCRITSDSMTTFEATGAKSDGEVEDYAFTFNFTPTAVTIGGVELVSSAVSALLSDLQADQMNRQDLLNLLTSWHPGAVSSDMDRAAIITALSDYLDPDGDGQVAVLRWDTLEERGTIGFYVERQDGNDSWIRINNDLLPGLITAPMGAEYLLADPTAQSGHSYQYRLIELEADGNTREYGPYTLQMP